MTGKLFTVKEVAQRLNISKNLMHQLIWANEIPYVDINQGGKYIKARFTEEHIQAFLQEREIKAG